MPTHPRPGPTGPLLLALSGNMLIDSLEVSTLVVAMPSIGRGLGVTPPAASWFMICFALGFGASVLPARRLTARLGRRRVYLVALVLFVLASLASALAVDAAMLDVARAAKGVCVALTAPTGLGIISATFAEGPPRQRAIAVYTLFGAAGLSAGLVLAGLLTDLGWRWTLSAGGLGALVLLPIAWHTVPADPTPAPTTTAATPNHGTNIITRPLLRSAFGAAALNGPFWGFLFVATYTLQDTAHWSPVQTGLILLPTGLPLALTALHTGALVRRFGPARLIAAAALAALAGFAWYLAADPAHPRPAALLPTVFLVGLSFVLGFSALHLQATSGVPAARQPAAAGFYQTAVQLGGAAVLALTALAARAGPRPAMAAVTAVSAAGLSVALAGPAARARRNLRKDHRRAR